MQAYIFNNPVTLMYGDEHQGTFIDKIKTYGTKVRVIYDISFNHNGFLAPLVEEMEKAGLSISAIQGPFFPSLNFVREQIQYCRDNHVEVVLGIGGGTCMDVTKTIAFGVRQEQDVLVYLNYSTPYDGSQHLPIALISTVPCSGTEMDDATQITVDETQEQFGLSTVYSDVSWLNPKYVMTLPDEILARSVMTSFVHTAAAFLGVDKSNLAEDCAVMFMNNIKNNLRMILDGKRDEDTIGNLMTTSAMHINGLTYLGKMPDMSIYFLNGFVQNAVGIPYTRAITTLFPYWLREIYHGQEVAKDFFNRVYGIPKDLSDDEILKQGLAEVKKMYESFGVPTCCKQIKDVPIDYTALREALEQFGPIDSQYGILTPEINEKMITDCINGNLI